MGSLLAEKTTEVEQQTCCITASSEVKVRRRTASNGNNASKSVCFLVTAWNVSYYQPVFKAVFWCSHNQGIENFIAARVLQGLGEAVEPVIIAMARALDLQLVMEF